jgi:dihydrofolate reductase
MAQFWPQAAANPDAPNNEAEFGRLMNSIRKIVVSTMEEDLEWTNSEQLMVIGDEDLVEKVEDLKSGTEGYFLLYGGVQTARSFIEHGLVDEYRLDLCPVALGTGKSIFGERTGLELVAVTPYESGAMTVTYKNRER